MRAASPPRTFSIRRPCAVVVSAQVSVNDLKPAPPLAICVEDIEQVAGRPPTPHFHGSGKPRACCFILSRRERARTEPKGANGLLGRVRLGPEHNTAPYVNR